MGKWNRFKANVLDPQAGLIAAIAVFLSAATAAWEIRQNMADPEPMLLAPTKIVIIPADYGEERYYVRLAAQMRYVNSGPPDKRVVIVAEHLTFSLGEESFKQKPQSFANFAAAGCGLTVKEDEDPSPIVLSGNDGTAHTSYFEPARGEEGDPYKNFVRWEQLRSKVGSSTSVQFNFVAEVWERESLTTSCFIKVDEDVLNRLDARCAISLPCATTSEGNGKSPE